MFFARTWRVRPHLGIGVLLALAACGAPPTRAPRGAAREARGALADAAPSLGGAASSQAASTRALPSDADIARLKREGRRLLAEKRFLEAAQAFSRALAAGDKEAGTAYNAACGFALAELVDAAFSALNRALALGFVDTEQAKADADLARLHEDPRWSPLLERMAARREELRAEEAREEARLAALAERSSLPSLSRADMLADFDALVKTATAVSPQLVVRAAVTGVDPLRELASLRARVDSLHTVRDFALWIRSALNAFQDGHTSLLSKAHRSNAELKRLGASDEAIALAEKYDGMYSDREESKKLRLPIAYVDGEYWTLTDVRTRSGQSVPRGSRITRVNGEPVHDFVRGLYPYVRMMRWDYDRGRYYSEWFYRADNFSAEDRFAITFAPPADRDVTATFALGDTLAGVNAPRSIGAKRVEWFDDLGILYVRMPEMNTADAEFYPRAIRKTARAKKVKKVVFDVRDNGGGDDGVWVRALAAVIPRPVRFTARIASTPNKFVLDRLGGEDTPTLRVDFLGSAEFRGRSSPFELRPDNESIAFSGPIYVLVNENVYSSAGAFVALAARADNVISVGARTGRLLGLGVSPLVFELARSKMLYRIEPVVDLTGANAPADVYHDQVERLVPPSLTAAFARAGYAGDPYAKEFLTTRDPVFRTVMSEPGL